MKYIYENVQCILAVEVYRPIWPCWDKIIWHSNEQFLNYLNYKRGTRFKHGMTWHFVQFFLLNMIFSNFYVRRMGRLKVPASRITTPWHAKDLSSKSRVARETMELHNLLLTNSHRHYMAGILTIRRKTQINQSIKCMHQQYFDKKGNLCLMY